MATVNPTITESGKGYEIVKWVLAKGDDGAPYKCAPMSDKSVEISGSLSTDGIIIEGTNWALTGNTEVDAESTPLYATLHALYTTAGVTDAYRTLTSTVITGDLSTTPQLWQIVEHIPYIRPRYFNNSGSGATATIRLFVATTSRG